MDEGKAIEVIFKDFKSLLIELVMISYVKTFNLPALREVKLLTVDLGLVYTLHFTCAESNTNFSRLEWIRSADLI